MQAQSHVPLAANASIAGSGRDERAVLSACARQAREPLLLSVRTPLVCAHALRVQPRTGPQP